VIYSVKWPCERNPDDILGLLLCSAASWVVRSFSESALTLAGIKKNIKNLQFP